MGTEANCLKSEFLYSYVPEPRHPPRVIRERLPFGLSRAANGSACRSPRIATLKGCATDEARPGAEGIGLVPALSSRAWLSVFVCSLLVTLPACRFTGWEEYMEAGYWAYQDGRSAEAEELFLAALQQAERFGPEDPRLATTLDNLADLFHTQGRDAESQRLYQRALRSAEEALGPEHPRVAGILNHLAGLYADQDGFTEAEPLYRRALAILETARGPDHPDVVQSLAGLAELYRFQNRYAEAEPLYQRLLALLEKALGPDHLDVAATLEEYAELLRATGREAQAAEIEARARAIRARVAAGRREKSKSVATRECGRPSPVWRCRRRSAAHTE